MIQAILRRQIRSCLAPAVVLITDVYSMMSQMLHCLAERQVNLSPEIVGVGVTHRGLVPSAQLDGGS
jgi:hypothetical protein